MSKLQVVRELHRQAFKNYPRRRFVQRGLDDTWQLDLIDLQKYARYNKGFKYILVCIDTFSKFLWTEPLKTKSSKEVSDALSNILLKSNRTPKNIQSDAGTEFFNKHFTKLTKNLNVNHYCTYSIMKASIAERVIRTIKTWLWQHFSFTGSYNWINALTSINARYNNRKHRTIKMMPSEVDSSKEKNLLSTVYSNIKISPSPKFQLNDHVRISKHKSIFEKGYTGNWTTEIFRISKIQQTLPTTYILKDEHGEDIQGGFYEQELQKVKYPNVHLIEKVIRKHGNRLYVKWLGFPAKNNSWVHKNDIVK